MTAPPPAVRRTEYRVPSTEYPRPLAVRRWVFAAVLVGFVVAHGCHGEDADTEPAAAPPMTSDE